LRRLRGHASAADLKRAASRAQFATMGEVERDEDGKITRVRVDLIEEDGTEQHYWLSGKQLDEEELERLHSELHGGGARVIVWYPLSEKKKDEDVLEEAA
jgi:hypothetical protein